ncbi:MAG: 50S ribosomal protein L21 [Dehalococcoidia bacterium]
MLECFVVLGGESIYAVVDIGGKQYKVAPKQTIEVERLGVPEGDAVEFDRVLFIGDDGSAVVGDPTIKGAKVKATSLGEEKGDKTIVFKYKPKRRYRTKKGHRQIHTKIQINEIVKG